ncbi:hypothetical protein G9A89_015498 [Geosiphon pyriformis]|nr:hypothetical protein G9A89_015498 [Geosiphon pyriformis]
MTISNVATDILIYLTMFAFMGVGLYAGLKQTKNKDDFLSALGTQLALPLAINWVASNCRWWYVLLDGSDLGSSVFFAYPELATIAGLLGVVIYALTSVIPLFLFAWLGPIMRRKCPRGFTLTQFIRERFGRVNQIYVSLMSMAYMFCYMISELSSIGLVLMTLTNVDKLAPIVVLVVTTTLYTAYGGFRASLLTDSVQGVCILILIIIVTIAFGTNVDIDRSYIKESGLLNSSKLGWELLYILAVAISFANFFHQGYWQRAFSSKSDHELRISALYGGLILFFVLFLIGFTGLLAVWAKLCCYNEGDGSSSFFLLLSVLPDWAIGIVIVLSVALASSAYDTLQSAMVSTISNDLFENRLPLIWIRGLTVLFNVPAVILGLRNLDVLRVFLIGDLVAAATMPPVLLGLVDSLCFIKGVDVLVGSIGGLVSIFIFGTIYFGNAYDGINLIQLPGGLYVDDYSVLGAFIVAPFGGLGITFLSVVLRAGIMWIWGRITGRKFEFSKKPDVIDTHRYGGDEFLEGNKQVNHIVKDVGDV